MLVAHFFFNRRSITETEARLIDEMAQMLKPHGGKIEWEYDRYCPFTDFECNEDWVDTFLGQKGAQRFYDIMNQVLSSKGGQS